MELNDKVPRLSLHYRYQLSIPRLQEGSDRAGRTVLTAETKSILQNALKAMENPLALNRGDSETPLCPPPDGPLADGTDSYQGFGPSHYLVEPVGDFAVWFDKNDCRLGRLIDWFGAYSENDGLLAQLWVKKPTDEDYETFAVIGRRRVVKIDSGLASFGYN